MTKRDLFRVTLKLAGLYFIITMLFNSLPSLIVFVTNSNENMLFGLLMMLFGIFIFLSIFAILIFKPDVIINILKLDKNFNDDEIRIKQPSFVNMLQWGIILLSLSVLLKHLPMFITNVLFAFKLFVIDSGKDISNQLQYGMLTNYTDWSIKIVALVISLLMLTNSKSIANYIIRKNKIDKIEN